MDDIRPDFEWVRFDSILYSTPNDSIIHKIPSWRLNYGYLLDNPISDSAFAATIVEFKSEPLVAEAFRAIKVKYPDLSIVKSELEYALRYMIYYYPNFEVPRIFTYVSGYDFSYPIKYSDTAMAIGLDLYLGKGFIPYRSFNLPLYKQQWMDRPLVVRDCIEEIFLAEFSRSRAGGSMLDYMVEAGKKYCFIEHMMPDLPANVLLKYTAEQLEWCEKNESNIWALFLEQQLLFSSDREKVGKFMQDAPFTPGFTNESPGRMADFIGWKLMLAFMKNNPETSLPQMILIDNPRAILDASAYKP